MKITLDLTDEEKHALVQAVEHACDVFEDPSEPEYHTNRNLLQKIDAAAESPS